MAYDPEARREIAAGFLDALIRSVRGPLRGIALGLALYMIACGDADGGELAVAAQRDAALALDCTPDSIGKARRLLIGLGAVEVILDAPRRYRLRLDWRGRP